MANPNDDSGERVTYPRHFPSAIGFPPPWTHVMSRWLAYFDGYDGTDHMDTIGKMKVEFPVLQLVSTPSPFPCKHVAAVLTHKPILC